MKKEKRKKEKVRKRKKIKEKSYLASAETRRTFSRESNATSF